jgi:hypothetical protein
MYDSFLIERSDGKLFDIDRIESHLGKNSNVAKAPKPNIAEFLFCRSPSHAAEIIATLKKNPNAEYPPIGVLILSPERMWVYQETTEDVMEHLRAFTIWLRGQTGLQFLDNTGKNIIRDESPDLNVLFG